MPSMTVTATQTGTAAHNGQGLALFVYNGAKPPASQSGANALSGNTTTLNGSLTPVAQGSQIITAIICYTGGGGTFTWEPSETSVLNQTDATNNAIAGFARLTSLTPNTSPILVGASAGGSPNYHWAAAEIQGLTTSSLALDASTPAPVYNAGSTVATTASFSPPAGALLVAAVIGETTGSGTQGVAMSDTLGLTWTQLVINPGSFPNTGIWVAMTGQATLGDAGGAVDTIGVTKPVTLSEAGGAVDSIIVTHPFGDAAGATDSISVIKGTPDFAGAVDTISVTGIGIPVPLADAGGAYDQIWVLKTAVPPQTPALTTLQQAPRVFVKSTIPRMHVQNLISGAWLHRDVQGITSPSVTWSLNAADSFTCTLSPPRADMMTSSGEPLLVEWRDACYLEEDGEIKWGGILTSSTFNGPAWQQTWTGFSGFPNGMVYEGGVYKKLGIEAMDVVRFLWDWVQSGQGASANLNMQMPSTNTGYKLGAQVPAGVKDTLVANSSKGQNTLTVLNPNAWNRGMVLQVTGDGETYIIKRISGNVLTLTTTLKGPSHLYRNKNTLQQIVPPTPYELDWWNSTDIGQEIDAIRAEAIFDWRETHSWGNSKETVKHSWVVGAPRLGMFRSELRFAEGENIVQPATVTRDGSKYAQRVIGVGNGQGNQAIRSTVTGSGGRLARSYVYTDQTVKSVARMTSIARKVQESMDNIDAVTQIIVKNHPHAPFGSYFVGDDINVILCTGWRNTTIKSRILSMTQDPTTSLMTLSLARSDSFTYMAQSGQNGTV